MTHIGTGGAIGGNGEFLGGPKAPSEEQVRNDDDFQQEKVGEVLSKEDARYDAMTPEERESYYVKPNLGTRLKKILRGRS